MEHYKITHFYANNKQSTDNQAVPIGDYPPEDIKNVSKKSHTQSEKSQTLQFSVYCITIQEIGYLDKYINMCRIIRRKGIQ